MAGAEPVQIPGALPHLAVANGGDASAKKVLSTPFECLLRRCGFATLRLALMSQRIVAASRAFRAAVVGIDIVMPGVVVLEALALTASWGSVGSPQGPAGALEGPSQRKVQIYHQADRGAAVL